MNEKKYRHLENKQDENVNIEIKLHKCQSNEVIHVCNRI